MNVFELVLFDADGTLLGSDGRPRAASVAVIRELIDGGVRVGLATGRSPRSIGSFLDRLPPLTGPCILFNGGMVWDAARCAPVWERRLSLDAALIVLGIARELRLHVNLYVDDDLLVAEHNALSRESEAKDGVPHTVVGDLTTYLVRRGAAPYKLLLINPSGDFAELVARCDAALVTPCTLVNSEPTYMELLPAGVCKGAALASVERHYGIPPARVLAFGDGKNDIELLERAGLGVAMGNAHPDVVLHADAVVGDHDTDALANFLRGFLASAGRLVPRGRGVP